MGGLITFEGGEGSGKSTQLQLIIEYLKRNNVNFIFAREPGGTEISEKIRQIILDKNNEKMCDECEALLYAAARCQLLKEVIIPALKENKLVILDRYIDSSFVYQSYARGLGVDFVEKINSFAIENAMPNLTFFFDISPENAFKRKGGADKTDRLELAGGDFHKKVYVGYKELCKKYPNRICQIDGTLSIEQIHNLVVEKLVDGGFL